MTRYATAIALGMLGILSGSATACPFCAAEGQTFTTELKQAQMVVVARPISADMDKDTSEIEIETAIKDDPARGKKTRFTLTKYIDPMPLGTKGKFILFCEMYKGKLDAYRGMFIKDGSKLPAYCQEVLKLEGKPVATRLQTFFTYLDNPDLEISGDAYKEFAYADYKEYRAMAKNLPADKILKWIKSPDTPAVRMGLYASMLGHCGKPADAKALRAILDDTDRRAGSGIDGTLAGYIMLAPKEGWDYTLSVLKNPKEDFYFRYAILRGVRFLYDYRPDLISKKQIVEGLCMLLDQKDIADLAIEDLRRWQHWEAADKILAIAKTDVYEQPIVKRSMLRFALQCKGNAAATAYVAARRKADKEAVDDAQELLDLETANAKKPVDPSKKK
jgi:hypothetical protein